MTFACGTIQSLSGLLSQLPVWLRFKGNPGNFIIKQEKRVVPETTHLTAAHRMIRLTPFLFISIDALHSCVPG